MENQLYTLYLIQHKEIPEYTKIGYTEDIMQRIKQLNTGSPTGIRVVYQIRTDKAYLLEQTLHKMYRHKQSNLEWFSLTHEDIVDIIFWLEDKLNERH